MQLNVIREGQLSDNTFSFENDNLNRFSVYDPIYTKFVAFLCNPDYIRRGINESVRTSELTNSFNNATGECITHTNKLPQFMSRFMFEYPDLSIKKQVKNYGTIYKGIGLYVDPTPEPKRPPLTIKEKNEKRAIRNRIFLDGIQEDVCNMSGWSISQYQQMVNLGHIYIIRTEIGVNIEAIISVAMGRLTQYVNEKIIKLRRLEKYAKLVKVDYEGCTKLDLERIKDTGPIYTNRLAAATRTYDACNKLERGITNYLNTIGNLPQLQYIVYPDIQQLQVLAEWLKMNSMHKTRQDMKLVQENYDSDTPELVGWIAEDTIYTYNEIATQITRVTVPH